MKNDYSGEPFTSIRLRKLMEALVAGEVIFNYGTYDPEKEKVLPNRNLKYAVDEIRVKLGMLIEYLDLSEIYTPETRKFIKKTELQKAEKKSAEIGRKTK